MPIYHAWKEQGAEEAVKRFRELKRDHADEYQFPDFILLDIGDRLLRKGHAEDAIVFLEASPQEYPDAKYNYYTHCELADANNRLGNTALAIGHCEKAPELKPDFNSAANLLEELQKT